MYDTPYPLLSILAKLLRRYVGPSPGTSKFPRGTTRRTSTLRSMIKQIIRDATISSPSRYQVLTHIARDVRLVTLVPSVPGFMVLTILGPPQIMDRAKYCTPARRLDNTILHF